MGESLHNSLIDILLLVGIDDNGTLQPAERETNGLETQVRVVYIVAVCVLYIVL